MMNKPQPLPSRGLRQLHTSLASLGRGVPTPQVRTPFLELLSLPDSEAWVDMGSGCLSIELGDLIGASPPLVRLWEIANKTAFSQTTTLLPSSWGLGH